MSLRSPLGAALGRGSAREGVGHWLTQRTTALAMLPLSVWLLVAFVRLPLADHAALVWWIGSGWNAALLSLTVVAAALHSMHSVQTIMEDYIHQHVVKYWAMHANRGGHILVGAGAIYAILRIALRGAA
jgi:succinate dehydrogenase / fumarate reductase membrane anchor subunit